MAEKVKQTKTNHSVARELAAKVRECYLALLEAGFKEEQSQDMTFDLYVLVSNEEDYQAGLTMEQIVAVAEARFGHPDFREFPDGQEGDGEFREVEDATVYFYTESEAAEMDWPNSKDNSEGCGNPSCPGCGLSDFIARIEAGESAKDLILEFAKELELSEKTLAEIQAASPDNVRIIRDLNGFTIVIRKTGSSKDEDKGKANLLETVAGLVSSQLQEALKDLPPDLKSIFDETPPVIKDLLGELMNTLNQVGSKKPPTAETPPAPAGDSTVAPSASTPSDYFTDEAASLGAKTPAAPPATKLSVAEQWGLSHLQLQGTVNDLAAKMGRAYTALQEHVLARPQIQRQEPTNQTPDSVEN